MPVEENPAILVFVAWLAAMLFPKASGDEAIMDEFSQLSPDPESGGAKGFAMLLLAYLSLGVLLFFAVSLLIDGAPDLDGVPRPSFDARVDWPSGPTETPVPTPTVAGAANWRSATVVAASGAWLRESADGARQVALDQWAAIEVDEGSRRHAGGLHWYQARHRGAGGAWEAGWIAFRAPDGSQLIDYVDRP